MQRWARIITDNDGFEKISGEVIDFNPEGNFNPSIKWIEVPEDIQPYINPEFLVVEGTIVPPYARYIPEAAQRGKLVELRDSYLRATYRPSVDTGLGFSVDAGRTDLENYKMGKASNLLTVVDNNGVSHTITLSDYDTIITAIEQYYIACLQTKWATKEQILAIDLDGSTWKEDLEAINIAELF